MPRPHARDDSGASAVEYGLVLVGIAALLVVILFVLGDTVRQLFDSSCGDIAAQVDPTAC